jgi:hypothetical protein
MARKLVSFYLRSGEDRYGATDEHLDDYLNDGWRIARLWTRPGMSRGTRKLEEATSTKWVFVLLERDDP